MRQVFGANRNFVESETPEELMSVKTDFESDFNAKGIATNRAAYRRRA
jgi:hypothetical protein